MENQIIETQNNSVATLFDKVKLADSIVSKATALNIEAANLQIEAGKQREKVKTAKSNNIILKLLLFFMAFSIIGTGGMSLFMFFANDILKIDVYNNLGLLVLASFVFGLFATAIVGLPVWLIPAKIKPYVDKAEECEKKSQELFNSSNQLVQEYINDLAIIPQKYWYPMATNFIVEVIQTGRATTIPLALDKLEEQIHRWNMEQSMQQQIAIQMAQTEALRRIEINTAASVVADVAGLFLG